MSTKRIVNCEGQAAIQIRFSSDEFTWTGREGSADQSDLGFRGHLTPLPDHIIIESTKTGSAVVFWATSNHVVDGDLLWTTYRAVVGGLYVNLTLFND
jgi:hypothetical protein